MFDDRSTRQQASRVHVPLLRSTTTERRKEERDREAGRLLIRYYTRCRSVPTRVDLTRFRSLIPPTLRLWRLLGWLFSRILRTAVPGQSGSGRRSLPSTTSRVGGRSRLHNPAVPHRMEEEEEEVEVVVVVDPGTTAGKSVGEGGEFDDDDDDGGDDDGIGSPVGGSATIPAAAAVGPGGSGRDDGPAIAPGFLGGGGGGGGGGEEATRTATATCRWRGP